jgi:hypothetical protein
MGRALGHLTCRAPMVAISPDLHVHVQFLNTGSSPEKRLLHRSWLAEMRVPMLQVRQRLQMIGIETGRILAYVMDSVSSARLWLTHQTIDDLPYEPVT